MKKYFKQYPAVFGNRIGLNIVTVCTIKDGDKFGRGVSICSDVDIPDENDGKTYAERYALHAIKRRKNILISDERAIRMLLKTDCPFIDHSQSFPILTWQERRFFFGKKFLKQEGALKTDIFTIKTNDHPLFNSKELSSELNISKNAFSKINIH